MRSRRPGVVCSDSRSPGVGGLDTYERAAAIERACLRAGEPIRSGMDCLIAAVAIVNDATLLHSDRDFDAIARHTELRLEPVGSA